MSETENAAELLARLRDPKTLLATLKEACGFSFEEIVAGINKGVIWAPRRDEYITQGRLVPVMPEEGGAA